MTMSSELWSEVDAYIGERLVTDDRDLFERILAANMEARLPAIDVSPAQGKFLNLLVKITGAKRVLEVGTLGGYSTVWMGKALPRDGRLISLEYVPLHAETARRNIDRAGLSDKVEVRVGAAMDLLPSIQGPFDLVFIDADKPNNPGYLEHALRLSRPGTVIVLDNVVRDGQVTQSSSPDRSVIGARAAFDLLHNHPSIDSTALQTVGLKGWDGFILGVVKAP
jgi:predicted O-methyltransferase YrrM